MLICEIILSQCVRGKGEKCIGGSALPTLGMLHFVTVGSLEGNFPSRFASRQDDRMKSNRGGNRAKEDLHFEATEFCEYYLVMPEY